MALSDEHAAWLLALVERSSKYSREHEGRRLPLNDVLTASLHQVAVDIAGESKRLRALIAKVPHLGRRADATLGLSTFSAEGHFPELCAEFGGACLFAEANAAVDPSAARE